MEFVPLNGTVLCRRINEKTEQVTVGGLTYEKENIDLYKVVELPVNGKCPFAVGDVVMSSSTGTLVEDNIGHVFYLFETDKLMGKVLD